MLPGLDGRLLVPEMIELLIEESEREVDMVEISPSLGVVR